MNRKDGFEVLACPRESDRPSLRRVSLASGEEWLVCTQCGFAYPVLNGIPHLYVAEAISPEEFERMDHGPI